MNRHLDRTKLHIALAFALCGLVALAAWSQIGNQPLYVTNDVPSFSRAMLKLRVEIPQLITHVVSATDTDYIYQPAGRFQIQTAPTQPDGGNPTRDGDENLLLASVATPYSQTLWGYEYSSKVSVAVDADEENPEAEPIITDPHLLAAHEGEGEEIANLLDLWPGTPTAGARDVIGTFRVPITDDPQPDDTEWINVRQVMTVVGDMVQLEFIATNQALETHTVGLRVLVDASFGTGGLDGRPVVLPDGSVIETETTLPALNSAQPVPDRWVSYDNPSSPRVVIRGILNTSEVFQPGIATKSAGVPDEITFGQMRNIGGAGIYDFRANTGAPFVNEDWAYAVKWSPETLAPGESRRFVTFYGLGNAAADYEPPYALMAYLPFALQAHAGNDPATPDVEEAYYLTDESGNSPFKVSAYMDNFGTSPIFDAAVRVRLPLGLELASGEVLTKSAGIIQRNEIKSVSWDVVASGARPGLSEVRFTGPRGKVVTRQINIPAVPVLNPWPNADLGIEMISVPYDFSNNDAEHVFASLDSLLPGGPAALIRYDPQIGEYRWFPDPAATTVQPGMGFWLLNRNRETVVLPSDARPVDQTQVYRVDLVPGWNQIGNPYTMTIRMDQVRVEGASGGDWSLSEAVSRALLLPTLFSYDPEANDYTWDVNVGDIRLEPYTGYWILARQACTLVFSPPTLYTPSQVQPLTSVASDRGSWKVDLRVSSSGLQTTTQSLAAHRGAEKGLDRFDVPQPPPTMKDQKLYLRSALYASESGLGMPYLVDTRNANEKRQQWNLVVKTNRSNADVTVSWPSLENLPSSLIATLVDEAAGQRRYMRTTTSYTFRTGERPTDRVLKIIVQPRPENTLAITGVCSAQVGQGGASITYTLSADANVDIRIRNISGVAISQLVSNRLTSAGQNTVLWNGRNARGMSVPPGRYLVEITARAPMTGQAISTIHPLELSR